MYRQICENALYTACVNGYLGIAKIIKHMNPQIDVPEPTF